MFFYHYYSNFFFYRKIQTKLTFTAYQVSLDWLVTTRQQAKTLSTGRYNTVDRPSSCTNQCQSSEVFLWVYVPAPSGIANQNIALRSGSPRRWRALLNLNSTTKVTTVPQSGLHWRKVKVLFRFLSPSASVVMWSAVALDADLWPREMFTPSAAAVKVLYVCSTSTQVTICLVRHVCGLMRNPIEAFGGKISSESTASLIDLHDQLSTIPWQTLAKSVEGAAVVVQGSGSASSPVLIDRSISASSQAPN